MNINTKLKNNLPKSWSIRCTNENYSLFKKTVIEYLNKTYNRSFIGCTNRCYGLDEVGYPFCNTIETNPDIQKITLEEFIEMSKPIEWPPKRGELVEVSNTHNSWYKRIFLTTIEGAYCPNICVDEADENAFREKHMLFRTTKWSNVRQIPQYTEVSMEEIAKAMNIPIEQLRIKK